MSDQTQQAPGTRKRRRHRGGNRGRCRRSPADRRPLRHASARRGSPPLQVRVAPRDELVNILEFEEEAKKKLQPATFALVAGGDRALFDRITLRPRMNIPTTDMDLTVNLFGEEHFTPIIVAPIADQKRFHPDAELATAKGRGGREGADDRQQPVERCRSQTSPRWRSRRSGIRCMRPTARRRRRCRTRSRRARRRS